MKKRKRGGLPLISYTKMKNFGSKRLIQILLASFLTLMVFFSGSQLFSKEGKNFQPLPAKKLNSKLRTIAYATIRSTLSKTYDFKQAQDYRYLPCSEEFPELPGDFPCNFLTQPEPQKEEPVNVDSVEATDDGVLTETMEGGIISAAEGKIQSPNLNGKVLMLGEGEEALTLFYHKNSYISHYRIGNQLVVFLWQNQKGKETLTQILLFKLNAELFPEDGKEVLFSR